MKILLINVFLLIAILMSGQEVSYKTINVHPYKYLQNYEHFKRLVLSSDDGNAEYIRNFDFEWGYEFKLKVKVTKLKEQLSDGTQYNYEYYKTISKTKVADSVEFRLFIDPKVYYYNVPTEEGLSNYSLKQINDSTFLYFEEVEIEVPKDLLKSFKNLIKSENGRMGYFVFINQKQIRLTRF